MNYKIVPTDNFESKFKLLSKKYRSLFDDLEQFKQELLKNPTMGDDLGDGSTDSTSSPTTGSPTVRKVRMAIASKNKGKRGGARVITLNLLIDIENTKIYLLTIYDKGEKDSISKEEILHLKIICGLTE